MTNAPVRPKIYHIVHVDRLASIIADGAILSYAEMRARGGAGTTIGMDDIKRRRLALSVKCWPGDMVGAYAPFYLCPRSVMLYVISQANHPALAYAGGQGPIVHLEADLNAAIGWAGANHRRWAISLGNAGAGYCEFRTGADALSEIDWTALASRDFRDPVIKERKQAEFLMKSAFPWALVERIGVHSRAVAQGVADVLRNADYRPTVQIKSDWYF